MPLWCQTAELDHGDPFLASSTAQVSTRGGAFLLEDWDRYNNWQGVDYDQVLNRTIQCIKESLSAAEAKPPSSMQDGEVELEKGELAMEVQLEGLDKVLVDAYGQFLQKAGEALGAIVPSAYSPKPTIERWSVLSSPHVHKTAWTQFERRTHKQTVQFAQLHPDLVPRLVWYSQIHGPPDVRLTWTVHSYYPVDSVLTRASQSSC